MNMKEEYYQELRDKMVQEQLIDRGITDKRVLDAMREVPREEFIPEEMRKYAYMDMAVPIDEDQTISQPYIVALMLQLAILAPNNKVMDIGTGSGYATAVLSRIVRKVVSIERLYKLSEEAGLILEKLGYDNITLIVGDGSKGHWMEAPYDAIVSAASPIALPYAWLEQLKNGGRLVTPLGGVHQELVRIRKEKGELIKETYGDVEFVPLVIG